MKSKRKLLNDLEEAERQQKPERKHKRGSRGKADSITHRLDRAEALIKDLSACLARTVPYLNEIYNDTNNKQDGQNRRSDLLIKWRVTNVAKLLEKSEEVLNSLASYKEGR